MIETPRAPRPWLLLCCVLVAVLASYIPVLGGPFIWDDHHLIEDSPLVKEIRPLHEYFGADFWQRDDIEVGRTYYRPLTILSLAIDHRIFGDNPGGFHLSNLLVHLASTILLFQLLRRWGAGPNSAALSSALWALHPRLTEAVAWISGRTDVLATFFVLAALLVQPLRGWLGRVSCALLLLCGLLCKEVAIAGVAAVMVLEYGARGSVRERLGRLAPVLGVLSAYLALRVRSVGLDSHANALDPWTQLQVIAASVGRYVWMFITPWAPDIQIGRVTHPQARFTIFGCWVLIALAWGAWRVFRQRKHVAIELQSAIVLTAVGFGVVLHVLPFSVIVIAADRFLYLPLAGLCLACTPPLARSSRARLLAASVGLLIASFGFTTFARASAWSDEVGLWTSEIRTPREDPSMPCISLGSVYARAGMLNEALVLFQKASDPSFDNYSIALNNSATALVRAGRYTAAAQMFHVLAEDQPQVAKFKLNLAVVESQLNDFDSARGYIVQALALYPEFPRGLAFEQGLPELERDRSRLDALPTSTPAIERAKLMEKLGLVAESLLVWRVALAAPDVPRSDFEGAIWFALREGDVDTIEVLHDAYRARFGNQLDPRLELAYQTHSELVTQLRAAWPRLGLTAATNN